MSLRKVPKVRGKSLATTLQANAGELDDEDPTKTKPIKVVDPQPVIRPVLKDAGIDLKSKSPKKRVYVFKSGKILPIAREPKPRAVVADEELTNYLFYEFAFKPRTPGTMAKMVSKARRWLDTYDLTAYSYGELYGVLVGSVSAAMIPPAAEIGVRAALQDIDIMQELKAHADFVNKGSVGAVPVKSFSSVFCMAGTQEVSLPSDKVDQ